ncbi:MAG TPA: peptide ABC transporter substrate-binding protein [Dongiaceae bacterium]|jgi:oligopeptide transport system substrate-binding protein|nr:peptide ABC transporter substrate-binding protein [Dongiaceae bacterium]
MIRKWGFVAAMAVVAMLGIQIAHAETVLRLGNGDEPETLDPAKSETVVSFNILQDAFEGLVMFGPKGEVAPGTAEKWEISDDGKTYTFHLRTNAKWSNGDPVTANDFVSSWHRALDPKTNSPYAYYLDVVQGVHDFRTGKNTDANSIGIKAIDDHTVQIALNEPTPYFLSMLRLSVTYPTPKAVVDKFGDQWIKPGNIVSNGAYMVSEWTPNASVTLVKNPHYYDASKVKIDKVVYYPISDEAEELKRYKAGELDITYSDVAPDQIPALKKSNPKELRIYPYFGTYYYAFNTRKKPFDNPKLRRALSMAIDRDLITKKITLGGEIPAYGFVPPGVAGYTPQKTDFASMRQQQRVAEAKKIMKELGYSESNPLKLEILYNTSDKHKKIAIAIQDMWKQIGIDVTLTNAEFKVVRDRAHKGDFDVLRVGWIGDYVDPTTFTDIGLSDSEQNDAKYNNPKFDELERGQAKIADTKKRFAHIQAAERILLKDLPNMPIYYYVSPRMVSLKVKNWNPSPLDYHPTRWLSLSEK